MLYRPEDFEPLTDEPWDEDRIRAGIREIVDDTDAAFRGPKLLWRADDWDRWQCDEPAEDAVLRSCGRPLGARRPAATATTPRRGSISPRSRSRTLERHAAKPDFMASGFGRARAERESALLRASRGSCSSAFRLSHRAGRLADDAPPARPGEHRRTRPTRSCGALAGTLIAARLMLDWTQDARWREAWDESADGASRAPRFRRAVDAAAVRAYGRAISAPCTVSSETSWRSRRCSTRSVGRAALHRTSNAVLERAQRRRGRARELAAYDERGARAQDGRSSASQWCHGAPGVVCIGAPTTSTRSSSSPAPSSRGAPGAHGDERGSSICHGTAGNGYALLKAFARTGDERWLERARRFAVHALAQMRRQRTSRGRGRYSLWTGDLGVALYLADCLDARTAYPVLDA